MRPAARPVACGIAVPVNPAGAGRRAAPGPGSGHQEVKNMSRFIPPLSPRLRGWALALVILLLLLTPFWLLGGADAAAALPFVGYTESTVLYDERGQAISRTPVRRIGQAQTLAQLDDCARQEAPRVPLAWRMERAHETQQTTTWTCR